MMKIKYQVVVGSMSLLRSFNWHLTVYRDFFSPRKQFFNTYVNLLLDLFKYIFQIGLWI
jgi:hypothetical protein